MPFTSTGTIDVCHNRYADLWQDRAPARQFNGTAYEEELFTQHSLQLLEQHDPQIPLFLVHAFHLVHTPLQVPDEYVQRFAFIDYKNRRLYAAMVSYMDDVVGRLHTALVQRGMWDNTLLLFASDNGGPIYYPGSASNHPLKGGKESDWEGGVRVNAFVSGGVLPPRVRGTQLNALCHIADWLATFAALAGVNDTTDHEAAAAGLPPVDSVNLAPLLVPPRSLVAHDEVVEGASTEGDNAKELGARSELQLSSQALLTRGDRGELYKLVVGWQTASGWVGGTYPNATGHQPLPSPTHEYPPLKFGTWAFDCGQGCLFDVAADETEHNDISQSHSTLVDAMRTRLDTLNKKNYEPDRGEGDPAACRIAEERYGGFYGPFVGPIPR